MVYGGITDRSTEIGTSDETPVAENAGRHYLLIQNIGAFDLWVNFGTAAAVDTAGSLRLGAYGIMEWGPGEGFVPTNEVHMIADGTAVDVTIKEG